MFKMQIDGIYNIIALVFLGVCAVFDIRKKEIPIIIIILGIIAALGVNVWQLFMGRADAADLALSLCPGLLFLLISFVTKEKIGYGDGLILIASGLWFGFYGCLFILCLGMLFSSIFSILLLVLHRADRNSSLPFVPFLLIGMGVSLFV